MIRVVVTGSRSWTNVGLLEAYLDALLEEHGRMELAHGQSKGGGADAYAADWAYNNRDRVDEWPYPVQSGPTGIDGNHRGAPLNRNTRMLRAFQPDLVVGFRSDGKSNGTDDCLDKARKMNYDVEVVYESEESTYGN